MAVIFIVFMLSLPVYLVGTATKNKGYVIASAIVMGVVAANTGSIDFLFIDLIGIGIATYLAFQHIQKETN